MNTATLNDIKQRSLVEIEIHKNNINIVTFLEGDKTPFESGLDISNVSYLYIGKGDSKNFLTKRYKIKQEDLYRIEVRAIQFLDRSLGGSEDMFYFVTKEFYNQNKEKFMSDNTIKTPKDLNLRIVEVKGIKFVSIGKGNLENDLNKIYNTKSSNIYVMDCGYSDYGSGFWGSSPDIEYWVTLDYYLENLPKFQKEVSEEPNYKVFEFSGVPYVSLGRGHEVVPLYVSLGISSEDIYRIDDGRISNGWDGSLPNQEYYVTESFYKSNIEKFQKQ